MKNILLGAAFCVAAGSASTVHGQHPYNFSKTTDTYTPLTNATIANNGIWYDTSSYTIPVGFTFKLNGTNMSTVTLREGIFIGPGNSVVQSGFGILGTTLQDRNVGKTTSASPIRYTTSGPAGSRIFKLEVFNAGFFEEGQYNTDNDSISYQVWIYEQNSGVDVRFGPSRVSHFADYFGPKVFTGYMKNMNTNTGSFDKFYLLNGDPLAPVMDSISTLNFTKGLSAVPPSGTVYRYVPRNASTGIGNAPKVNLGRIYPSPVSTSLTIESVTARRFRIVSISGAVVQEGNINSNVHVVNVSSLTPGTYMISLINDRQETDSKQLIIE